MGPFRRSRDTRFELIEWDRDVFDALALPSIGDVDVAARSLDDRRITEFAWFGLKRQERLPRFAAVGGDGHIQRRAVVWRVVVDHEDSSIRQLHGVNAAVGIGQWGRLRGTPGAASIE